jgi:uncharacterized membrane protein SpoIIM required for sporulation
MSIATGQNRTQTISDAKRFELLLDRSERSKLRGLALDELRELISLYRVHSARLARLRETSSDEDHLRYVNALCVRAHTLIPAPTDASGARSSWTARARDALRRTWHAQVLAWCLLGTGLLIGGPLVGSYPEAISVFVPRQLGYSPASLERLWTSREARAEFLQWEASDYSERAFFGSMLFAHNTRVGLLAFAVGVLAGIPTLLLQLYNGVIIGALAAIFLRDDLAWRFLAWILPHGIPELAAISMCVAGGLLLGEAVAVPGRRGRAASLKEILPSALMLLAMSIPLFLLAAFIESFVRESGISTAARYSVVAACCAVIVAVLVTTRQLAKSAPASTDWMSALIAPARSEAPGND